MTTRPCASIIALPYRSDSCAYFERIRHLALPIFLDSNANASAGRFDIITAAPAAVICDRDSQPFAGVDSDFPIITNSRETASLQGLPAALRRYTSARATHDATPFVSGAIGLVSYDWGMRFNGLEPSTTVNTAPHWPELIVGIFQWALVQDHSQKQCHLFADPKLPAEKWQSLSALLAETPEGAFHKASSRFALNSEWMAAPGAGNEKDNIAHYNRAFEQAQRYIQQGDCYQINLAQQMTARYSGDSWHAYQLLRQRAPTPFAAYMQLPKQQLLSLSPERFIQIEDTKVTTQPIKGTRKRGSSRAEDTQLMAELSGSDKDRAENLMIVDLMRNDLGKCCKPGSIDVPALFQIETYPNVHHMVSTITGELANDNLVDGAVSLLEKALPGGSVTGAPKKRSMEIIDELESFNRSVYCGSIFYINNNGDMDSNILIRSLLCEQDAENSDADTGKIYCWGGGGIVADSVAELEYEESLQKVRNLMQALAQSDVKASIDATASSEPLAKY